MNNPTKTAEAVSHLQNQLPEIVELIAKLKEQATAERHLNAKTKCLLALILAINNQQEDCVTFHLQKAITQKVSLEEMQELVAISAYMGGGPGMMKAEKALKAFETMQ